MAICPECHYEYPADILACPDCQVSLAENLTARRGAIRLDESWVVVGLVSGGTRSEIAKGSLDSGNIPSVILASDLKALSAAGEPKESDFSGSIIMVPREFREEAETILIGALGNDLVQPSV